VKLDRTTYEAWLLDRIEGNLTPDQERELDVFLSANPDLSVGDASLPSVHDGTEAIEWKQELKKSFPPAGLPDIHRLDDFLVARLEGALTPRQEQGLEKLLFEHPELEQDARRMAAAHVKPKNVHFTERTSIERHFPPHGTPDKHRITDFLIAAGEGDLNEEQARALRAFVANDPHAQHEERLVKAARVVPEPLVFASKEGLKKREARVISLHTTASRNWYRYAAAASIALLLGLVWIMTRERAEVQRIANNDNKTQQEHHPAPIVAPVPEHALPAPEPIVAPSQRAGDGASGTTNKRNNATPLEKVSPAPSSVSPQVPVQDPLAEPQLAQQSLPVIAPQKMEPTPEPAPQWASKAHDGQRTEHVSETVQVVSLATFAANAVRKEIGEGPRGEGLDKEDALAAVNKGLDAITGGKAELEVQRNASRKRFKLRLGSGFAITASNGR
jgi:hypothetical protein